MQLTSLPAESLAPIRARFIDALRAREARIREVLALARPPQPDQLRDDIHKIRGVAPMLGLGQLGALAADAEDRLEPWLAAAKIRPAGMEDEAEMVRMPDDLHACLSALHAAMREAMG